ncbi:MAG TPA: APC family permease, partial [Gemmatimonadaceae bacterium]|nr:APC family permease [Gemmatimonadaceae bacterium]
MTVAVSTSSAVEQLISVAPGINAFRVEFALVSITLITVANLRGLRESGNIFAIPTYLFLGLALTIVGGGIIRIVTGEATPMTPHAEAMPLGTEALGLFLVLKAFASGSVALTGTEAIANGVPAFKPPEAKNAANTLVVMAVLLAILFIGITLIADAYHIVPSEEGSGGPTVIALVAQTIFGAGNPLYYVFQLATALILFLAANTSYNAFPRLAALLAHDGYMPRQFSVRGDRLAFSWGIVLLSAVAGALIVWFGGVTTALIPLYSVGVFVCFTLSQGGMVLHWIRRRGAGWWWRLAINAFGALLTAVVLVVVASVKFFAGAYLVVILIPLLVAMMLFINRQYAASARQLAIGPDVVVPVPSREERAIVPVPSLNRAVVRAVNVARSITNDVSAVFISEDA